MKKSIRKSTSAKSEIRSQYDFASGVRGKHHKALQKGYTIRVRSADGTILEEHRYGESAITLAPDVREYFPDSKSVNHALRTLIDLVPTKRQARGKAEQSTKQEIKAKDKSRAKKLR
jgi:hypothetical protein